MSVIHRNKVTLAGKGKTPIIFSHGYGCDQNMWRYVAPAFTDDYLVVLFDHVGAGGSDLGAYSKSKYGSLEAYADDVVEIVEELDLRDAIFVGHSVSAMIGVAAVNKRPERFRALIMVAPSPCYLNDGEYMGGFTRHEIDDLLKTLDSNHLGWSASVAPVIMGNPDRPELTTELANSFCRTDPAIAKQFARVTFLSDCRAWLSRLKVPSLIMQCSNDMIAPQSVGEYIRNEIADGTLVVMKATGHCPNLSAPKETIRLIKSFLGSSN